MTLIQAVVSIIGGLIGLSVVLYGCIGKPLANTGLHLVNVNENMKKLTEQLKISEDKNSEAHGKLWNQINKHGETIMTHDAWIEELKERTKDI